MCTRHGAHVKQWGWDTWSRCGFDPHWEDLAIALTSVWLFPRWKGAARCGSNERHSGTVFHSFYVPCIPTLRAGALLQLPHFVTQQWEFASFHQCEIKAHTQQFKWTINSTPFQQEEEMSASAQILQTQVIATWKIGWRLNPAIQHRQVCIHLLQIPLLSFLPSTHLPQASFPWGSLCLQHPSIRRSGNLHGGALLPFEIFALTTCPMTFSSSAFLTPSHATTLPFSKHFPQGSTSCSLCSGDWYLPSFQSQLTWLDLQPPHSLPASPHWGKGERQHSKRESYIWINTPAVPSHPVSRFSPIVRYKGADFFTSVPWESFCVLPFHKHWPNRTAHSVKRRPRKLEWGYTEDSNPDSSTAGSQFQSKIRPSGPPLIFPLLCSPSPPLTPERLGQRCFRGDRTVTGTEPTCQP